MILTYSPTIRRKEMEAVLTCMVDEKIGSGELNLKLVQTAKELIGCDGAVALRSPSVALEYALKCMDFPKETGIMISALAPVWQLLTIEKMGFKPVVLDVCEENGLVTIEEVEKGIKNGGRLLILTESMGILPDIKSFMALEIPIIEDVSQSAMAYYPFDPEDKKTTPKTEEKSSASAQNNETPQEEPKGRRAGMYGVYSIMGMESKDVITGGGGALLMAPGRKEWIILKNQIEKAPETDIMSDMNAALAYVELKEYNRNEKTRQELFTLYSRSIMSSRHKTYTRGMGCNSTIYSFPLVLNTGFKDAKAYAQKKGVEISIAYENSVIAYFQERFEAQCICANSLLLRCALFPLYPRLGQKDAAKIVKILASLP